MESRGSLTRDKLEEIFRDLAQNQFTGNLAAYDEKAWKEFYFASTGVRITSVGARKVLPLGEILLRLGLLDEEDQRRVLARQREKPALYGEAAVELGLADEEHVDTALRTQAELELLDLYFWRRPTFEYRPGLQSVPSPMVERKRRETGTKSLSAPCDVLALIQRARALHREIAERKRRLPRSSAVFGLTDKGKEVLFRKGGFQKLPAIEQRVIILLDGRRTLADLFARAKVLWTDVMRVVDRLVEHGAVQELGGRGRGPGDPTFP